ncbi:MAG: DUF1899 domain-containing protein [Acidobacteriia bacterium]|nr:DUF1899 domain-containing protein [Terriglobia bacterium]
MQDDKSERQATGIVTSRTRWLAVATGFFTVVAGTFAGGLFLVIPIPLILGAIIQPRFPRAGRGLICAGAVWLTFWVFDVGIFMVLENRSADRLGGVHLITAALVLLVALCDLAIVIEEVQIRRT